MTVKQGGSRKSAYWIGCGVAVVALASLAVGLSLMGGSTGASSTLPEELGADALKTQAEADPAGMMETVRETVRREDLTDAQRREFASNMRQAWRSIMAQRIDEWYAAPTAEDKTAVLDRQIDDFMQRRAQWQRREEELDKEDSQDRDENRERFRRMFASQSKDERKTQSESRNPDQMARAMVYFSAVRARMAERGISMSGRRGGRRWGP